MTWEKSCWVCKGGCVGLRIDFSGAGEGGELDTDWEKIRVSEE